MDVNKKIPAIRFSGFDEEWKAKLLGKYSTIIMGQSPQGFNYTNNPNDHILVQGNADLKNGEVFPRIWTTQVTKVGSIGDIIFTVRAPVGEVGISTYNVVLGRGVASIKGNHFLYQLLKKFYKEGYWKRLSAGSTFDSINSSELSSVSFFCSDLYEQTKIGTYFKELDELIRLQEQKHKKFVNLKKAMLDKMFPKVGADVPEIRFKGFTDKWEEALVGKYYNFKNGLNKSKEFFGYGTPIVNFTDVYHNRGVGFNSLKGRVCLEKSEINNFKVEKGDIFFTRTSETIIDIGYPSVMLDDPNDTVFSGFVLRGRAIELDPLVISFKRYVFFTKQFRKEMIKKSSMTTRALTSGTAIKNMLFKFPKNIEEQEKIGKYFENLDNLISQSKEQINKYKNIKQALLQKMFV